VLGVDGGGSKTRALIAEASGAVLGVGEAGPSNPHVVGRTGTTRALLAAVRAAFADATGRAQARRVAAACLGMAGMDTPEDATRLSRWAIRHGLADRVSVVNDCELLLSAGTDAGWGLAVICGTGSICYGRGADGQVARAGGWGHLIGDEGSGYALSIVALRLAARSADGRAGATELLAAILRQLRLATAGDLLHWVYAPKRTHAEIDPHARALVEGSADELARAVRAVQARLRLARPPLALGGSLLVRQPFLRDTLLARLDGEVGSHGVVEEPARGAIIRARAAASAAARRER
jgi:N-acetylglucosamine kinase-like BadF-type ATPase